MNITISSIHLHYLEISSVASRSSYPVIDTGKSMSEALILESVNPQYYERLFIEFPEKY